MTELDLEGQLAGVVELQSHFVNDQGVVNGIGYCTGSLIGRDLVLTAAHCVSKSRSLSEVKVIVGPRKDADGKMVGALFETKAAAFVSHVDYNPQKPGAKMPPDFVGQNDLALIRLAQPAPESVSLITVGDMSFDREFVGDFLISGHGVETEDDPQSRRHRKKQQRFRAVPGYSDRWFDLESSERVQMCVGDSGGPLLVNQSGKLFLVGVFESAPACQAQQSDLYISRMTRSGAYFDWISANADFAAAPGLVSLCAKKVFRGTSGMISNTPGPVASEQLFSATPVTSGQKLELLGSVWQGGKHYALVNSTGITGYIDFTGLEDDASCPSLSGSSVAIRHAVVTPPVYLSQSGADAEAACAP